MGTRGAFGFLSGGQTKVTYNHWDSYPTSLGVAMLLACAKYPAAKLKDAADKLVLVKEDEKPTPDQIEIAKAAGFVDLTVGNQTDQDWYNLLRGAQGDIAAFIEGRVPFMIDSEGFLADSLFCEWAYIINVDTGELEVYQGYNKDGDAPGRYAHLSDGDFRGVVLKATFPLAELFGASEDKAMQLAQALELEPAEAE